MPQAPLYTSWLIRCRDANAAVQLGRRLTEQGALDQVIEDVVRTTPGGVENRKVVPHPLGDYFAAIRLLPIAGDAAAWRLVFERRPDAGRFWKDLMVNILQETEKEPETTTIALGSKEDEPPEELVRHDLRELASTLVYPAACNDNEVHLLEETMERTIFYSWQSDSPRTCNRDFIRECLDEAVRQIAVGLVVDPSPRVDAGMEGVSGSPEVATVMFRKIDSCALFVGDVTLVGEVASRSPDSETKKPNSETKKVANPNVLLEMGYAAGRIGWERIICVMNEKFGKRQEQAFDVRNRRFPIDYTLDPLDTRSRDRVKNDLVGWLKAAIEAAEENEHQLVQDVIERLDAECIAVMITNGKTLYFHTQTKNTYGELLATMRRDDAITRLLSLKLLRYDHQRVDVEQYLWSYHWTYLGKLVLKKLNLIPPELLTPR